MLQPSIASRLADVLADGGWRAKARSEQLPPAGAWNGWATKAVRAYHNYKADRIIAEKNQGGEMVETTIRMVDASVPYRAIHASRGKVTRAEPVSALYEQGKVHHVGTFSALEDQMCSFTSDFDRNRAGYSHIRNLSDRQRKKVAPQIDLDSTVRVGQ